MKPIRSNTTGVSIPKRKGLGNRGFTLMEVVFASVILGSSVLASLTLFRQNTSTSIDLTTETAIGEVEDEIKTYAYKRVKQYFETASQYGAFASHCNDSLLPSNLQFQFTVPGTTLSGLQFEYMDDTKITNLVQEVANFGTRDNLQSPTYKNALARCRNQTILRNPNFSGEAGLYFCAHLQATGRSLSALDNSGSFQDIRTMQPAFAEVRYIPMDAVTGTGIPCNAMTPYLTDPITTLKYVGMLYYNIYWVSRDQTGRRLYKHFSNLIGKGQVIPGS